MNTFWITITLSDFRMTAHSGREYIPLLMIDFVRSARNVTQRPRNRHSSKYLSTLHHTINKTKSQTVVPIKRIENMPFFFLLLFLLPPERKYIQ